MKFAHPTIVTITAPTCAGKSVLIERLCSNENFARVVSCTSRHPRQNEVDGVDYHFLDASRFEGWNNEAKFVEINKFLGNYYGTSIEHLMSAAGTSTASVVIVDPNGLEAYEKVARAFGVDIFKIFVHVTENVRLERLLKRRAVEIGNLGDDMNYTTIDDEYARRIQNIKSDERLWMTRFIWDAIVPGDDLEKALAMIEIGVQNRNKRNAPPAVYNHQEVQ